jgi:hypothetical protein
MLEPTLIALGDTYKFALRNLHLPKKKWSFELKEHLPDGESAVMVANFGSSLSSTTLGSYIMRALASSIASSNA